MIAMAQSCETINRLNLPREAQADVSALAQLEARRAQNYPLSRWYLRPLAVRFAAATASTWLRPTHLTALGLLLAAAAGVAIIADPALWRWAGALVLAYWFCDRADGLLARRQSSQSAAGAWLDANVDEAVDLGLHAAVAWTVSMQTGANWPVWLLATFAIGKYLLMYGLHTEEAFARRATIDDHNARDDFNVRLRSQEPSATTWARRAYHLPANADIRVHALAIALIGGWAAGELAFFAAYYHLRWIVRYALVGGRLQRADR